MTASAGGRLEGKTALITGGAGSIGFAAASLFVREGARVMLVDLNESDLQAAVAQLPAERAGYAVADVTQPEAVQRYVDATVARFGKIDVLFSNAGISARSRRLRSTRSMSSDRCSTCTSWGRSWPANTRCRT